MNNMEKRFEEMEKEVLVLKDRVNELEKAEKYNREVLDANFLALYRKMARKKNEQRLFISTFCFCFLAGLLIIFAKNNYPCDLGELIAYMVITVITSCVVVVSSAIELRYFIPELLEYIKNKKRKK